MPTILIFVGRKNSILGLSDPEKSWISWYFYTYEHLKFHAQLSWEGFFLKSRGQGSLDRLISDSVGVTLILFTSYHMFIIFLLTFKIYNIARPITK